jgi:LPXTG-motif cell wall-anchored protein
MSTMFADYWWVVAGFAFVVAAYIVFFRRRASG